MNSFLLVCSQSAQNPFPGICFIVCSDAESAIVGPPIRAARAAFEDSIFCKLNKICCSIACTHSSRSSLDCASKHHCLSNETIIKIFSSPSSSPPLACDDDLGVAELYAELPEFVCCARRCRFFALGVSIFPSGDERST